MRISHFDMRFTFSKGMLQNNLTDAIIHYSIWKMKTLKTQYDKLSIKEKSIFILLHKKIIPEAIFYIISVSSTKCSFYKYVNFYFYK